MQVQTHCLHGGRLCQPTVAVSNNTSACAAEVMKVSASKPITLCMEHTNSGVRFR